MNSPPSHRPFTVTPNATRLVGDHWLEADVRRLLDDGRGNASELLTRALAEIDRLRDELRQARPAPEPHRATPICATCGGTGRELLDCDGSAGYRPCPQGCPRQ